MRRLTNFFEAVKDGVYPNLKQMSQKVMCFPEVQRRIDTILDRFGDVKDTASDNLLQIRKSLKSKESAISKRANAILKQAQADGMIDSDATLSVREGKLLIPVNASNKKKIQGLVYDTSSTGKTVFIEPAEIVEIENDIIALHNEEAQEIQRILAQFSDFVRPYVPDLIESAEYVGEIDFLVAKGNRLFSGQGSGCAGP